MRYHLTPAIMTVIKENTNNKCSWGCREKGTLINWWWELVQLPWRRVWRFHKKTKNRTAIWPSDPTPGHISRKYFWLGCLVSSFIMGIYLKKSLIRKNTCTRIFIAALFVIANTWTQPKCLLTCEWIKEMWSHTCVYTHTHTDKEYYSAIKKNEIMAFAATWMDLRLYQVK